MGNMGQIPLRAARCCGLGRRARAGFRPGAMLARMNFASTLCRESAVQPWRSPVKSLRADPRVAAVPFCLAELATPHPFDTAIVAEPGQLCARADRRVDRQRRTASSQVGRAHTSHRGFPGVSVRMKGSPAARSFRGGVAAFTVTFCRAPTFCCDLGRAQGRRTHSQPGSSL